MYLSLITSFYEHLNINQVFELLLILIFIVFLWRCIIYFIQVNRNDNGIHYVENQSPPLLVETLDNPFTFNMDVDSASLFGIQCSVKCRESCFVQALWGVPFDCLIHLLSSEANYMRRAITSFNPSEMFGKDCIDYHIPQLIPADELANLEYKPRDHTESFLTKPECKYLASFVLLLVLENDSAVSDTTVVAMANVIHVPNKSNPQPSCLKYQIIKLASGVIGNVEQIFHSSSLNNDNSCSICYTRLASIVFIPCRHCCLCSICYQSLKQHQAGSDRCPVCRQIPARLFQLPNVNIDDHENTT